MGPYDDWYVANFGIADAPYVNLLAKHLEPYLVEDIEMPGGSVSFGQRTAHLCLMTALYLARPICNVKSGQFASIYCARLVIFISTMEGFDINYKRIGEVLMSDAYMDCTWGQEFIRLIRAVMINPGAWKALKNTVFEMTDRMYHFLELPERTTATNRRNLPGVLKSCSKRYGEISYSYKPEGY